MTPEVFNYLAPKIIYGCGTVRDIPVGDVNIQAEEGNQVDESGPSEKGIKNDPIKVSPKNIL